MDLEKASLIEGKLEKIKYSLDEVWNQNMVWNHMMD